MKAIFAVTILTIFVTFVHTSEAVTCPPENEELVTLLPNPLDCTTFYICDKGKPHLMKCNPGLHFNPTEKVCDWPEHANCHPVTTTELPETTTSTHEDPIAPETTPLPLETTSPAAAATSF